MNQTEIGKFITKCRKEKKLTQAQLAEKLNITDRAVSKWETGKSMPDSSVMLELCDILGITVNELLSGEKIELPNGEEMDMELYEKKVDENLIALKKKDENSRTKNRVAAAVFSFSLLIGLVVCLICDLAITGGLTWSLIPASSIIFAWAVSIPGIIGEKGNNGEPDCFERFFGSLLISAEPHPGCKGGIFAGSGDGSDRHCVSVDWGSGIPGPGKKPDAGRSGIYLSVGYPALIYYQRSIVQNDCGACP